MLENESPEQEMCRLKYIGTSKLHLRGRRSKKLVKHTVKLFLQGRTPKNLVRQKNTRKRLEIRFLKKCSLYKGVASAAKFSVISAIGSAVTWMVAAEKGTPDAHIGYTPRPWSTYAGP